MIYQFEGASFLDPLTFVTDVASVVLRDGKWEVLGYTVCTLLLLPGPSPPLLGVPASH